MRFLVNSVGSLPNNSNPASATEELVLELEPDTVVASHPGNDDIDAESVAKVEEQIKKFAFMFRKSSRRRQIFVHLTPVMYSAGKTIQSTSQDASTVHIGAFSVAGNDALRRINNIIQEECDDSDEEYTFAKFLDRMEKLPCNRLLENECEEKFERDLATWRLVSAAALASKKVYSDEITFKGSTTAAVVPPKTHIKAFSVFQLSLNNKQTLIVTVRGTVGVWDWLVNANGAPKRSEELLERSIMWHAGFFVVASGMQNRLADHITTKCRKQRCDSIILTGHSAGGAIAQIFFAMIKTAGSKLAQSVSEIPEIHCISFAAPPVANIAIPHERNTDKPGLFINVINEGDIVPLAQETYINCLLDIFTLPDSEFARKCGVDFHAPSPVLQGSGECVVLRDIDPDSINSTEYEACVVERSVLDTKLFGNPSVHQMSIYMERVENLLEKAKIHDIWTSVAEAFDEMDGFEGEAEIADDMNDEQEGASQ